MKFTGDAFSAKDFIAQIIPGIILVFVFSFSVSGQSVPEFVDGILDKYSKAEALTIFVITVLGYFLGGLAMRFGFTIREYVFLKNRYFPPCFLSKLIESRDKTGRVLPFMKKEFGVDSLSQSFWNLHFYCKLALGESRPYAIARLDRSQSLVCVNASMITISLFLVVVFGASGDLYLLVIALLGLFYFGINLYSSTLAEVYHIYLSYYLFRNAELQQANGVRIESDM